MWDLFLILTKTPTSNFFPGGSTTQTANALFQMMFGSLHIFQFSLYFHSPLLGFFIFMTQLHSTSPSNIKSLICFLSIVVQCLLSTMAYLRYWNTSVDRLPFCLFYIDRNQRYRTLLWVGLYNASDVPFPLILRRKGFNQCFAPSIILVLRITPFLDHCLSCHCFIFFAIIE